jgi:hypothetical protein
MIRMPRNSYRVIERTKRNGKTAPWAQVRYWWLPFVWITLYDDGEFNIDKPTPTPRSRSSTTSESCHDPE